VARRRLKHVAPNVFHVKRFRRRNHREAGARLARGRRRLKHVAPNVFHVKRFRRRNHREAGARLARGPSTLETRCTKCVSRETFQTPRRSAWHDRVTRHESDATLRRYIRAGTMFDRDPLRGVLVR
jgi:hypothetical protein